jgi:hypothetical protein
MPKKELRARDCYQGPYLLALLCPGMIGCPVCTESTELPWAARFCPLMLFVPRGKETLRIGPQSNLGEKTGFGNLDLTGGWKNPMDEGREGEVIGSGVQRGNSGVGGDEAETGGLPAVSWSGHPFPLSAGQC